MFTKLFYTLKNFGVPVSMNEWQVLLEALDKGMSGASLTGFYYLSRAVLVKSEAHHDRFDLAFATFFGDIETPEGLPDRIWEWLDKELPFIEVTEEMRRNHHQLDLDEMKRMLEERLAQQGEEHHGGNFWLGTGGTSPFGHSGYHPGGIARHNPGDRIFNDHAFRWVRPKPSGGLQKQIRFRFRWKVLTRHRKLKITAQIQLA